MKRVIVSICILLLLYETAFTQLSHTFTLTARHAHSGIANDVAVGLDGTIFLANGDEGLWAYSYNGTSFTNTAHINDGNGAIGVAVGLDGTVFLGNGDDGLRAYHYTGTSFTNIAHINDGGARKVAVDPSGTVFLAGGRAGLLVYMYSGYISIDDDLSSIPVDYALLQNYPNPFNPTTTIEISIPKTEFVTLKIYNILGEEVATLISEKLSVGKYKYEWNAGNLASGMYMYRLEAGSFQQMKKLLLLK